jgi:hypothetical protein
MHGAVANAAMKHAKKGQDELTELRRKTKHQEAALKALTQVRYVCTNGGLRSRLVSLCNRFTIWRITSNSITHTC